MVRNCLRLAFLCVFFSVSATVFGAGTMSFGTTAPTLGATVIGDLTANATIPGGTSPGGGAYNSQAFSDNGGPPGQTFTTPTGNSFNLNSISILGANTGGGNSGNGVFTAGTLWSVRISSVGAGGVLTPLDTINNIATVTGAQGNEWYTFAFSAPDVVTLAANKQYAFDLFSGTQNGNSYLGFAADTSDGYAGGTAFNSATDATGATTATRSFSGLNLGLLSARGYDRTFAVSLTAVPEPASLSLIAAGLVGLFALRRKLN
jgi:PEP-CTERM motif